MGARRSTCQYYDNIHKPQEKCSRKSKGGGVYEPHWEHYSESKSTKMLEHGPVMPHQTKFLDALLMIDVD